ncbi:MAG: YcxB family protein [Cytophagales bacterium]|jgi:ABC-type multidrug transport system fused ATPase/permease subunit|nr:YcxB family protein [Cytophagales bacterium]
MDIKTKPFALNKTSYIKLCHGRLIKKYKWIGLAILSLTLILALIFKLYWLNILSLVSVSLFYLFWIFVFYLVTKIQQTKMIFDKYFYTISNDNIFAMIDMKKGMCIPWDKIKNCEERKDGFLLGLTQSHIVYLPHKIFKSDFDISRFRMMLKNKKYFKK